MTDFSVDEILDAANMPDLLPGQKVVKPFKNNAPYKSHCVVYNWKDPNKLRIEVKPGITGKDLPPNELRKYPVSLQAPTYFEFDVQYKDDGNDKSEDEKNDDAVH